MCEAGDAPGETRAASDPAPADERISFDNVQALWGELCALAQHLLRLESRAQSLTPTALVLTALRRQRPRGKNWQEVTWANRRYFFGAMSNAMQRALIDHARRVRRRRRLPVVQAVRPEELDFADLVQLADEQPERVLALHAALEELAKQQPDGPELVEIVEFRYYAGYTVREVACVMGMSERTIRRKCRHAELLMREEVARILNAAATGPEEAP
jgi:RNA polymerase sigma-70 factor, ECF subfamily